MPIAPLSPYKILHQFDFGPSCPASLKQPLLTHNSVAVGLSYHFALVRNRPSLNLTRLRLEQLAPQAFSSDWEILTMDVGYRDELTCLSCDPLSRQMLPNMVQYSGTSLRLGCVQGVAVANYGA